MHTVKEGNAKVELPQGRVFYNPTQVFNRDFSCLSIQAFAELYFEHQAKRNDELKELHGDAADLFEKDGLTLFEALGASGLRSLRYATELPRSLVKKITCNDIDPVAVEDQIHNRKLNNLAEDHFECSLGDAIEVLQKHRKNHFDIVDLDPYGAPGIFLDSAINATADKGLLLVTSTDLQVLCTTMQPDQCFIRYGAVSAINPACHEIGLRIAIYSVQQCAAKYSIYAEPILSFHHNHYQRVMFRIHRRRKIGAKEAFASQGFMANCPSCTAFWFQPFGQLQPHAEKDVNVCKGSQIALPGQSCPCCGCTLSMAGPMYLGPIHQEEFINKCQDVLAREDTTLNLKTKPQIGACLTYMKEELANPLFFTPSAISRGLKVTVIRAAQWVSALNSLGYKTSVTHCCPEGIKTDAPIETVFDVLRAYIKKTYPEVYEKSENSLKKDLDADFEAKLNFDEPASGLFNKKERRSVGAVLFTPPPEENWGPKAATVKVKTLHAKSRKE